MGTVVQGNFGLSRVPSFAVADERSDPIPTTFQYWTLKKTAVGICYIVGWFDDPKLAVVTSAILVLDVQDGRALSVSGNWYSLGQFESMAPHQAQQIWDQFMATYEMPQTIPFDPASTPSEFFGEPLDALAAIWACSSDDGWINISKLLDDHGISF